MKVVVLLNYIFFSKKVFKKPKKIKYLIYDAAKAQSIINALSLKKNSYEIYYNRYNLDLGIPKINLFIIMQMLISLKLRPIDYKLFFFKYTSPELVFTLSDNNEGFFLLKRMFPKIKFICIQCSWKHGGQNDIFYKKNFFLENKIELSCDYYFSYNKNISKKYSKFIKAKFIEIGSFNSNNEKKLNKKKIEFLYISQYKINHDNEIFSGRTKFKEWRLNEIKLLKNLSKIFKERNIKITIIGRCVKKESMCKERLFFKSFFPDAIFIENDEYRKTYNFVDSAKLVIGVDSTLAYESFIRRNRTIFFSVRNYKKPALDICRFGWPKIFSTRGPFWTNSFSTSEINRLLNLYYADTGFWKKIYNNYIDKFGVYDFRNKKFRRFVNQ
jgi:surface carbohydrate biosynthesis protein